jgi:hypothetical protein
MVALVETRRSTPKGCMAAALQANGSGFHAPWVRLWSFLERLCKKL